MAILTPVIFRQNASPELSRRQQHSFGGDMSDKDLTQPPAGEFIMFASGDGAVRVECRFEQETLWLPQATIANLYQILLRPSLSTLKRFMKKVNLTKTQPVSLTYKFNRKVTAR